MAEWTLSSELIAECDIGFGALDMAPDPETSTTPTVPTPSFADKPDCEEPRLNPSFREFALHS